MKVLQVLDKQARDGGVAVHVEALSRGLRDRGVAVETLRLHPRDAPAPSPREGDRHRLPFTYGVRQGMLAAAGLDAILDEVRPDIVHLHGAFTRFSHVLLERLQARGPLVATLHDTRPFCYAMTRLYRPTGQPCQRVCGAGCFATGCLRPDGLVDSVRWLRRWRVDSQALRAWAALPRLIAPSQFIADLAARHGFRRDRLEVVPHATPPVDAAAWPRDDPPLIVFAGRMVEDKGPLVLLRALAALEPRPWRAVLIGGGPLAAEVDTRIDRLGLRSRVEAVGQQAPAAVEAMLARARLVVMPSLVAESFGLSGLEALAAATPVIAFAHGGVLEWLRDGRNGLAIEPFDAAGLSTAIARLLDDEALARRLGEAGREDVRRGHDPARTLDRMLAIYEALTS